MKLIRIFFVLATFIGTKTFAAIQPDSILITDRSWFFLDSYNFEYVLVNQGKKYTCYQTSMHTRDASGECATYSRKKTGNVPAEKIVDLLSALSDPHYSELKPENFGYNHEWIQANADRLFHALKFENGHWSKKQKVYVQQQLSEAKNFEAALKTVVGRNRNYDFTQERGIVFEAVFYFGRDSTLLVSADENLFGMPWSVGYSNTYNPEIPLLFSGIIPENYTGNKVRFSHFDRLPFQLASIIFDDHCSGKLYSLAPLRYRKAISTLKDDFPMVKESEYGFQDGYVSGEKPVVRIQLHDSLMLSNVSVNLYLSKNGTGEYAHHSFLKKADSLANQVQSIPFICHYLQTDTSRKLTIDIENNTSVNTRAIEGFNQSPVEWQRYETLVRNWRWIDSLKLIEGVNTEKVLTISKKIYCGCDFRLDNNTLKDGLFFVIHDERHDDWSTWILLPDSTLVLWWVQGDEFANYRFTRTETFGQNIQHVCRKFDRDGKMLNN